MCAFDVFACADAVVQIVNVAVAPEVALARLKASTDKADVELAKSTDKV